MMATDVISENIVDAASIPDPGLTTSSVIQNGQEDSSLDTVAESNNEEAKIEHEAAESAGNSAEVSINGGSDNEASRTEASKGQDGSGLLRNTSSVKKPISFKAVSVNKTFLAAKVAGSTTLKPGEKPLPGSASSIAAQATTSAPRPRLVAKAGSGLRDSAPRTSGSVNGVKVGTTPDASAVWNKNRPAPPPEQKRFTDEELKQQYGIHLATRLQSDDPGRQANWADIDDDDDDWAPESIEWTDGTKISLPQVDDLPPVPPPQADTLPTPQEASAVATARKSPTPQVLTPSAVKLSGFGSVNKGLVLKGAVEKPTLVAKPPGPPTPVKSPWAQLPPVEKAAPVSFDQAPVQRQQQQQSPPFLQRDPHGFEAMPTPAKEMAADDFSRSWKDGNQSASRELYNSQSGRYEPVSDGRRGSIRNDSYRQPAVLQRSSQGDQQGPAEPSAAFQTYRSGTQEISSGRRRASSNLSGGSGNLGRRMSRGQDMHPPHEGLAARRGSLVAVTDSPDTPRNSSPSAQQSLVPTPQAQQAQSPLQNHVTAIAAESQDEKASVPPQAVVMAAPLQDEVELQKKIMRESRELAKKRRQEEEAKEDAARKERIRLKLEAMGPAPESKRSRKELPRDIAKEDKPTPTTIQAREAVPQAVEPPAVEVVKESAQEEMPKPIHPGTDVGIPISQREQTPPGAPSMNGIRPAEEQLPQTIRPHLKDVSPSQAWKETTASSERYASWSGPPSQTVQGRNVWGPPTSDKTLGNGTFNPGLSRMPEMHEELSAVPPGPIGPPSLGGRVENQPQPKSRGTYAQKPSPIGPPQRSGNDMHQDQHQRSQASNAWNALPDQLAKDDAEARLEQERQGSMRGVSRNSNAESQAPTYKDTWKQVTLRDDGVRSGVRGVSQTVQGSLVNGVGPTWNDAPIDLAREEAEQRPKYDHAPTHRGKQNTTDIRNETSPPLYNDAWRHANMIDSGPRTDVTSSHLTGQNVYANAASPPVRGSRFFPVRDVRLEDPNVSFTRPGSPSPPPPTMLGHPAYDGDSLRPHVSFPKPPPVVRLPPPPPAPLPVAPPKPVSFAAAVAAAIAAPTVPATVAAAAYGKAPLRAGDGGNRTHGTEQRGPQQSSGTGGWQDRINSLMGRRSSPNPQSLPVDSASKDALDLPTLHTSATVSLPTPTGIPDNDIDDIGILHDDREYETKPLAEECFEEQEMGSLPPVKVPAMAPQAAWHPAMAQNKPLPKKFLVVDPATVDELWTHFYTAGTQVLLPGMAQAIVVPSGDERRQRSNPKKNGPRGGSQRHVSTTHLRGRKGRDMSGSFHPGQGDVPNEVSSSARGAPRGRGGYHNNWNPHRHVSAPQTPINV